MIISLVKTLLFIDIFRHVYPHSEVTPLKRTKRLTDLENKNVSFKFDCTGRAIGFYADVEYDCQIFHMCDNEGKRVPHMCANDTSFNQEYRICDWEYNFDCSQASNWYYLNELTYATDPTYTEDYDSR